MWSSFFNAPFRPFFFLAASYGLFSILFWLFWLTGLLGGTQLQPTPFLWHGHELIFGFASAIIAGFLLTASANWTGRPTTNLISLAAILALWLLGRAGSMLGHGAQGVTFAADLGFWLLLTILIVRVVYQARSWRNLGFAVLPLAFLAADALWHYGILSGVFDTSRLALWGGVDLLTLIMGAMGGRVIPFFTGRRLVPAFIYHPDWRIIAVNVALIAVVLFNFGFPSSTPAGIVMIIAGLLLLIRQSGWEPMRTVREPMLWILHLGYAWLGVGLVLRGIANFTYAIPETTAFHAITVGALGCLGLGMLTRVALGHTGRAIQATHAIGIAFICINLAAVARLMVLIGLPPHFAYAYSGMLWVVAFAIYLWRFIPVLVKPAKPPEPHFSR